MPSYSMQTDNDGGVSPDDEWEPIQIVNCRFGSSVVITLGGDDLRRLGINPDDVDVVRPRILNGALLVDPVE